MSDPRDLTRDLVDLLSRPIDSRESLERALVPPLAAAGLLSDRQDLCSLASSSPWSSLDPAQLQRWTSKGLASVQNALLDHGVLLAWYGADEDASLLLERFFCPPAGTGHLIALSGYYSILSAISNPPQPSTRLATSASLTSVLFQLLARLSAFHSIDSIFDALFTEPASDVARASQLDEWDRLLRLLVNLPSKVANAASEATGILAVPESLEWRNYLCHLTRRFDELLSRLSHVRVDAYHAEALSRVVSRFIRTGFLATELTLRPSMSLTSFWDVAFPLACSKLLPLDATPGNYSSLWQSVVAQLEPTDLVVFGSSLFTHIQNTADVEAFATEVDIRRSIKSRAALLARIIGKPDGVWDTMIRRVALSIYGWKPSIARTMVAWVAFGGVDSGGIDEAGTHVYSVCARQKLILVGIAVGRLLEDSLDTWAQPQIISHAPVTHYRCKYRDVFLRASSAYLSVTFRFNYSSTCITIASSASSSIYRLSIDQTLFLVIHADNPIIATSPGSTARHACRRTHVRMVGGAGWTS
jgi:hypothetical protein